ncbi:uncharacterized protein LOC133917358 [Phragmites australis]|uniref:uncharacterized protein LOC133917358 n=1 Tax=Phragmites australis TaxID=29695 RepID=UPI002D784834|nr:uncharacterized protein LOC133917358 [Phragmites australis]
MHLTVENELLVAIAKYTDRPPRHSWRLRRAFGKFKNLSPFKHRNPTLLSSHMAAAAADDSSPPQPGGWIAGLVSGAGRLLAAVLGPESSAASSSSSSSQESSQSQMLCESAPLFRAVSWRPPRASGDHGNGAHFASDDYQYKVWPLLLFFFLHL